VILYPSPPVSISWVSIAFTERILFGLARNPSVSLKGFREFPEELFRALSIFFDIHVFDILRFRNFTIVAPFVVLFIPYQDHPPILVVRITLLAIHGIVVNSIVRLASILSFVPSTAISRGRARHTDTGDVSLRPLWLHFQPFYKWLV
jgi:hypothetical protein